MNVYEFSIINDSMINSVAKSDDHTLEIIHILVKLMFTYNGI